MVDSKALMLDDHLVVTMDRNLAAQTVDYWVGSMDSHLAPVSDLHSDHMLVVMKADCLVTSLVGYLE